MNLHPVYISVYLSIYGYRFKTALFCVLLLFLLFQVAGRYRVMVESSMASTDDIIFNSGDVIQLLHEDMSGMW